MIKITKNLLQQIKEQLVLVVFLFASLISALIINDSWNSYTSELTEHAEEIRQPVVSSISRHFNNLEQSLQQFKSLINTFYSLNDVQFHQIARQILEQYSYIEKAVYMPRIMQSQRVYFKRDLEDDYMINFNIREYNQLKKLIVSPQNQSVYYPFMNVEPRSVDNIMLHGFNAYSITSFSQAIDLAISSGEIVPLTIDKDVYQNKNLEYWLLLAVYSGFTAPESIELRTKRVSGIIAYKVDLNNIVNIATIEKTFLNFEIFTEVKKHKGGFKTNKFVLYNNEVTEGKKTLSPPFTVLLSDTMAIYTSSQSLWISYEQFMGSKNKDLYPLLLIIFLSIIITLLCTFFMWKILKNMQKKQLCFESLMEKTTVVPWEADTKLNFIYIGAQFTTLTGYKAEQCYDPIFWNEHIHHHDNKNISTILKNKIKEGNDFELEFRFYTANGSIIWLKEMVTLIYKNNRLIKLQGFLQDITEYKNLS